MCWFVVMIQWINKYSELFLSCGKYLVKVVHYYHRYTHFHNCHYYLWRAFLVAQDKESACQCRRLGFNPWVRKIPWRRKYPLQYSCLENPMDSLESQRSLAGYSPWGHKELDKTEWLKQQLFVERILTMLLTFI